MKNILLYMGVAGVLFASCDPNEDIYKEIDEAAGEKKPTAVFDYTLSEDDYEFALPEEDDNVEKYGNFSSVDDAKAYIPNILSNEEVFGHLGGNSQIMVTYDLYQSVAKGILEEYTATAADYAAAGGEIAENGYVAYSGQIPDVLDAAFPNARELSVYDITVNYRSTDSQRTYQFVKADGQWVRDWYSLSSSDFAIMGEPYSNFDSYDNLAEKLPVFANNNFVYSEEGDVMVVEYDWYNGDYEEDRYAILRRKNGEWLLLQSVMPASMQFGYEAGTWVPDNTIAYALTADDYTWIGETAIADGLTSEGQNLLDYGNFNLYSWEEADIIKYISTRLKMNFPDMEEGQKYLVSYAYYHGSSGVNELLFIMENGEYVIPEE